jgi:hypothetical protein
MQYFPEFKTTTTACFGLTQIAELLAAQAITTKLPRKIIPRQASC